MASLGLIEMAKFILSKSKVKAQMDQIRNLGIISYSFKTNPKVGQILEQEEGCDFSVHFVNELNLIKDRSRVWFLAQALNNELLAHLFSQGVSRFVIENEEDLAMLTSYITGNNLKIELLLRMKLKENTVKTERYYVFGIESKAINRLIPELKANPHISKLGVHFHRKTQNVSEWDLIREISELIDDNNWQHLSYLNIGGGLPVMYKNISDRAIDSAIKKISELSDWLKQKNIALIIEPGRFICGPAITLETEIVGIHGNTIVVDASVYNSSPDTLIVPIKLLVKGEVEPGQSQADSDNLAKPYVIKGITPCSTDLFRYRVYLKGEPKTGETLTFLNAGAYNFHTEFCELNKVETVVLD